MKVYSIYTDQAGNKYHLIRDNRTYIDINTGTRYPKSYVTKHFIYEKSSDGTKKGSGQYWRVNPVNGFKYRVSRKKYQRI